MVSGWFFIFISMLRIYTPPCVDNSDIVDKRNVAFVSNRYFINQLCIGFIQFNTLI